MKASVAAVCVLASLCGVADLASRVNPFIGTSNRTNGHTHPAACVPFGFVQAGPDTGTLDWRHCSGYAYEDALVYGFSQNHLSGTGCPSLGDVLLQPFTGQPLDDDYRGAKDFASEKAEPGYYAVALTNFGVKAEMTASRRVAWYRFAYPKGAKARLLVDPQWGILKGGTTSLADHIRQYAGALSADGLSLAGGFLHKAWLEREVHFVISFSTPVTGSRIIAKKPQEKADRYLLDFDLADGEPLLVKVAISSVDGDGAARNLAADARDWNFDAVRRRAREAWNGVLSRATARGLTEEQETIYYTALYHAFVQPSDMADADGRFRDARGKVQTARTGRHYTSLSLWDTFRACHPLYTLVTAEAVPDFVETLLAQYRSLGYLPVMSYFGRDPQSMIGNHAVSVVVDAYLKGFGGFDPEEAFKAVDATLSVDQPEKRKQNWHWLDKLGYYSSDKIEAESISRTLECGFDDWCALQMAERLGKKDRAAYYRKRAEGYRLVFDKETRFFRGRDAKGRWDSPFDPCQIGHDGKRYKKLGLNNPYTEGNAWQYTWHLLQSPETLVELMGGGEATVRKLDEMFATRSEKTTAQAGSVFVDVTGLWGQYAHGNEPCHHVAWLYACAGRPDRAAERLRAISRRFYTAGPDGLCGNDDCGQMSAWYLFACYGFYPVNPCGGDFVIGAPQAREATLDVGGGRKFRIVANGLSERNLYVRSVRLNGKPYGARVLKYADIKRGGELAFEMGDSAR